MSNSLEDYQLEYEEMEPKFVGKQTSTVKTPKTKVTPAKPSLKSRVASKLQPVRGKIDNIIAKVKQPRKKSKKLTKTQKNEIRRQKIRGIIGIGLLFVVVSIAYSTYMTNLFVDGWQMVVALTPQVVFAVAISIYAFYKIYK